MPTSDPRQLGPIVQELVRLAPASVLDVGAGYGKYGPLIREYVDDCQWRVQVDAIEGFADYVDRSPAYRAYDHVHVGTLELIRIAETAPAPVRRRAPGRRPRALPEARRRARPRRAALQRAAYVIVATPREPSDQGDPPPYGNDLRDAPRALDGERPRVDLPTSSGSSRCPATSRSSSR
jgi:hypothetical protein